MTNVKPNFQADLGAIHTDVEMDVEAILALSKSRTINLQPENKTAFSIESKLSKPSAHRQIRNRYRRLDLPEHQNKPRKQGLENVTTRLTAEINDLLTESALRQKLAKRIPSTRQDIIEEALHEWFIQNGYLKAE